MNTIFCASLQREHELQTGETLTLAQVAALSQYDRIASTVTPASGLQAKVGALALVDRVR
jgi:hypothetical protein